MNKIKFRDISIPLKIAVIFAYLYGILIIGSFSLGFLIGLIESIVG